MTKISQTVKMMLLLLAMSAWLAPGTAAAPNQASQQDKATACNNMADKKGLKGDDRKNFMQDCLSKAANTQPPSEMSQKDKMNACKNLADKRSLTGSDRRSFIKDCMNKANPK